MFDLENTEKGFEPYASHSSKKNTKANAVPRQVII
jgi:hypothetical protein